MKLLKVKLPLDIREKGKKKTIEKGEGRGRYRYLDRQTDRQIYTRTHYHKICQLWIRKKKSTIYKFSGRINYHMKNTKSQLYEESITFTLIFPKSWQHCDL